MITPHYFQPDPSWNTTDYTFVEDKYSCVSWVYPLHIIFAYLVVLTGLLALLGRFVSFLKPYHQANGRLFIIFMFWCMATSLLIHNAGLPFPIIISFIYLLCSMSFGWLSIKGHIGQKLKALNERMSARFSALLKDGNTTATYNQILSQEKYKLNQNKTFAEKIFSYRMAHGLLMAFCWAQMVGRTFVTNPFKSWHGCWSYPAYKQVGQIVLLDSKSYPAFPMQNSTFIVMITVPTLAAIFAVGCGCAAYGHFCNKKQSQVQNSTASNGSGLGVKLN